MFVKTRPFYGYIIMVISFVIMVIAWSAYYSFGVFFNSLLTEFGWTRTLISGAHSFSMIMYGLSAVVMGKLADRFGPRTILTLASVLIGLGYLLTSQVNTAWQLYLFYGIIVGMGLSGVLAPLLATIARWFVKRRGMMTGIVIAGVGVGLFAGPLTADWLIRTYDWRTAYLILGGTALVVILLSAQFLKTDPAQLGQIPYGGDTLAKGPSGTLNSGLTLREAIRTRRFWLISGTFFSEGLCVLGITTHIVAHALRLEMSATSGANILATIGVFSIIGKLMIGIVADRIGHKQALVISFVLMAAALVWLVPASEMWTLFVFAVVFGLGYGGCATSGISLVGLYFGVKSLAVIIALVNVGFTFGAALGPVLAGYIFDISATYQVAFVIFAITGIIGLAFAALLPPPER